jgi:rod shape-determining protein MreD
MRLTLAAAMAILAALAEFTVVPYLKVDEAAPHPVLVFGVIWAIVGGLEAGLTWAFVGGLALDILGQRALGSSAFSLLIAIGVACLVGAFLSRVKIAAPVAATVIASLLYSMLLLATTTALTNAPLAGAPLDTVAPSALYDAVLAVLVGPLAVAIVLRRRETERAEW